MDGEIELFFPEKANSASLNEFYSKFKVRTSLVLKMITGEATEAQIREIDAQMIMMNKPMQYSGTDGIEAERRRLFVDNSLVMQQVIGRGVSDMTVREFIQAGKLLRKRK